MNAFAKIWDTIKVEWKGATFAYPRTSHVVLGFCIGVLTSIVWGWL